jgi:hypothetical protein
MIYDSIARQQSAFIGLHSGEQQDFLDTVGISKKHSQSIETHTPTSSRRETIF